MLEILIFYMLLLVISLAFSFRPLPILAIPIGLLTWYISATQFLTSTELPVRPYSTLFLLVVTSVMMLINAFSTQTKGEME